MWRSSKISFAIVIVSHRGARFCCCFELLFALFFCFCFCDQSEAIMFEMVKITVAEQALSFAPSLSHSLQLFMGVRGGWWIVSMCVRAAVQCISY